MCGIVMLSNWISAGNFTRCVSCCICTYLTAQGMLKSVEYMTLPQASQITICAPKVASFRNMGTLKKGALFWMDRPVIDPPPATRPFCSLSPLYLLAFHWVLLITRVLFFIETHHKIYHSRTGDEGCDAGKNRNTKKREQSNRCWW